MFARLRQLLESRALWRLAALLGTLILLVACWVPTSKLPSAATLSWDKLLHAIAFLAVSFCWRRAGLDTRRTLLLCLVLAVGTEVGQSLLAGGRQGDVLDVLADLIGAVLGTALAVRLSGWPKAAPRS